MRQRSFCFWKELRAIAIPPFLRAFPYYTRRGRRV